MEANESGLASCYLNAGEYVVTAASNDMYCAKAVIVEAPAKIIIPLILDADGDGKDDNTGENDESSDDWWDDIDFGGVADRDYGNEIESGTCGENVSWTLYGTGLLVISGTGEMTDYESYTSVPWYTYRKQIDSVRIENGVTTIGSHAFYWCTSLSSIVIPDGVTTIGSSVFENCDSLSSIVIPDGATTIGSSVFENCDSLSSIVIPDGVTTIGSSMFENCDSLSSIVIPDSVTTIGGYAFAECYSLCSVVIGNGVTTISSSAFNDCMNLEGIYVDARNKNYSNDDRGVLFDKRKTALICAPGAINGIYSIPNHEASGLKKRCVSTTFSIATSNLPTVYPF